MDASFDGVCSSWRDIANMLLANQVAEFACRERAGRHPGDLLTEARDMARDNIRSGLI
jgi:hypothetical protein